MPSLGKLIKESKTTRPGSLSSNPRIPELFGAWSIRYQRARKIRDQAIPQLIAIDNHVPEAFDASTEVGRKNQEDVISALEEGDYETLKEVIQIFKPIYTQRLHRRK